MRELRGVRLRRLLRAVVACRTPQWKYKAPDSDEWQPIELGHRVTPQQWFDQQEEYAREEQEMRAEAAGRTDRIERQRVMRRRVIARCRERKAGGKFNE